MDVTVDCNGRTPPQPDTWPPGCLAFLQHTATSGERARLTKLGCSTEQLQGSTWHKVLDQPDILHPIYNTIRSGLYLASSWPHLQHPLNLTRSNLVHIGP